MRTKTGKRVWLTIGLDDDDKQLIEFAARADGCQRPTVWARMKLIQAARRRERRAPAAA